MFGASPRREAPVRAQNKASASVLSFGSQSASKLRVRVFLVSQMDMHPTCVYRYMYTSIYCIYIYMEFSRAIIQSLFLASYLHP